MMPKKLAVAVIFSTSVVVEIVAVSAAVLGPAFQRLFSLSRTELGICLGATSIGSMFMSLAAGHIVYNRGAFPVLMAGLVGIMAAITGVILATGFPMLAASMVFFGIAFALVANANTSQLTDLFPDKIRRTMSLASALWFGSSAFSAPIVGLWSRTAHTQNWGTLEYQVPYIVGLMLIGLCLVLAFHFIRQVATPPSSATSRAIGPGGADTTGKTDRKHQWIWIVLLAFGHGLMIITLFCWIVPMVNDRFMVEEFRGAIIISGISLGHGLGRLLLAGVRRPWDELRLLRISSLLGGIFFALGLVSPSYWLTAVAMTAGGLASSATYPCIMSLAGHRFPRMKSKMYGYVMASISFAGFVGPALVGFLADNNVPLPVAMGLSPLACVMLVVVSLLWARQDRLRDMKRP